LNDQSKGLLITTLGVLCVVPDALFIRLISADAMTVAFWRLLTTGLVVLLVLGLWHGRRTPAQIVAVGRWGAVYAVFAAVSALFFVASVKLTTVANTTIIIASMPVFAAIISWLALGEKPSRRMFWTIVFVFAGLLIIGYGSLDDANQHGGASLAGDLAALAVSVCFAIALTAARKARAQSMIPAVPFAFIACSICLLPFVEPFSVPLQQWWLVALHGGFFIALSSCFLALGPRYISSAEVALLILLESVLAPLLVWLVIGEQPGYWTIVGGVVVLGVLVVSNVVALRRTNRWYFFNSSG
jgi:drug/metabolite transporter (DMT)-like permease